MYSLNVPVPAAVARLASDLARELPDARARVRGEHTLLLKRLRAGTDTPYSQLEARARDVLRGQAPFELRVPEVGLFREAASGPSPVVYLAVESPELHGVHRTLATAFDPVEEVEGENYVPHVTIARGGSPDRAERLAGRSIEPITWTATELVFWDAEREQPVSRLSLPA